MSFLSDSISLMFDLQYNGYFESLSNFLLFLALVVFKTMFVFFTFEKLPLIFAWLFIITN